MADNIIMPQLGESIAEGTIVKWLKEAGQKVQKDENVLLISTDKVEAEIPSPSEGILINIAVGPGETVPVGTVLGQVGAENEAKSGGKPAPAESPKAASPAKAVEASPPSSEIPGSRAPAAETLPTRTSGEDAERSFLSPLVKKIASENRISHNEISNIDGTGRGGRVSKNDLLSYIEGRASNGGTAVDVAPPRVQAQAPSAPLRDVGVASERTTRKPLSTMRRVIMENMVNSKATSAHVTTFFEVDYTAVDRVRAKHKEQFLKEEQVSLTYTTFLAAAVCQVLKRHPYINATLTKDAIVFNQDIHLGIAVSIEEPEPGLMVPIIKNADKQNLRGLAHAIADLGGRVRSRKIRPDEISGGTFTITNPGNYGAVIGTPIINQPQVAILGVGKISKMPTVITNDGVDCIGIKNMGLLALSFDHRLIDGATADQFMADLVKTIETWTWAP
jgi:pyruvate dehydrogenase E2 component (dihydrolipoamide acetyltransferase)